MSIDEMSFHTEVRELFISYQWGTSNDKCVITQNQEKYLSLISGALLMTIHKMCFHTNVRKYLSLFSWALQMSMDKTCFHTEIKEIFFSLIELSRCKIYL